MRYPEIPRQRVTFYRRNEKTSKYSRIGVARVQIVTPNSASIRLYGVGIASELIVSIHMYAVDFHQIKINTGDFMYHWTGRNHNYYAHVTFIKNVEFDRRAELSAIRIRSSSKPLELAGASKVLSTILFKNNYE